MSDTLLEFMFSLTMEDFRPPGVGCEEGVGDIGRDPGMGVLEPER